MDPQPPGDWRRRRADAWRHVFAGARFPVYGLASWAGEPSWRGHGAGIGGTHQVALAHGDRPGVVVETCCEQTPASHQRQLERALMQLASPPLAGDAWQGLSPAALAVQMEHEELRVGAVVTYELTIEVDGRSQRFLAGRCGDGWAAVATLDGREDLTVTITADRIAPEAVALERIADVEPYLDGPHA